MLIVLISFLFFCRSGAKTYRQPFNYAPNTRSTSLSDGSRINGNAIVLGGALQLTAVNSSLPDQRGEFFAPALAGSSRGWTCTFSVRLIGGNPPADGVGVAWGNVNSFVGHNMIRYANRVFDDPKTGSFVACMIDTFTNGLKTPSGFLVANRTFAALQPSTPLQTNDDRTARVFFAWNPEHGITLRTEGLRQNADLNDVKFDHSGSDTYSWWFVAETGAFSEFAIIDNIVIDAPCGDCVADDKTCVWLPRGAYECRPRATTTTTTTRTTTRVLVTTVGGGGLPTTTVATEPSTSQATTTTTNEVDSLSTTIEVIMFSMSNESDSDTASVASAPMSDTERVFATDNAVGLTQTELGIIIGVVVGVIVLLVVVVIALLVRRQREVSAEETEASKSQVSLSQSQRTQVYGMIPSPSESTVYTNTGLAQASHMAEYDATTSPLR